MNSIPFDSLPGFPALFLDYVNGDRRAYPCSPTQDTLLAHANRVRSRPRNYRSLARALEAQASDLGKGSRALAYIGRLENPESVIVIAGESPGLFGGRLSTLLKCLTLSKLASWLDANGVPAIPLFLVSPVVPRLIDAGTVHFATPRDGIVRLRLTEYESATAKVDPLIPKGIETLIASLPEGHPAISMTLGETHLPGTPLSKAFASYLTKLTGNLGILFLNPATPELEDIRSTEDGVLFRTLLDQASSLPPNNPKRDIVVGYRFDPGDPPAEGGFHAVPVTSGELTKLPELKHERLVINHPFNLLLFSELLSPVAIVGGPGEIATILYSIDLVRQSLRSIPLLWPQASATLVDGRVARILEKYDLQLEQLYVGAEKLFEELGLDRKTAVIAGQIEGLQADIDEKLGRLESILPAEDRALVETIGSARAKMFYQLSKLGEKSSVSGRLRKEAVRRHLDRTTSFVAPRGHLQEQFLGSVHLLLSHGEALIPRLLESIDLWKLQHQLIFLE